jgi:hypothetical protein
MFSFLLHSIKMIKNPLKRVNTYTSWFPLSLCFSKFLFIDIFVGRKRRDVEKWFWLHAFEFVDHVRLIHEVSTNYRELRERVPKLPLLCIIRLSRQLIQREKSADWNIQLRLQFRIGYTAGIKSRSTDPSCRRASNQKGRLHHAHLIRIMHDWSAHVSYCKRRFKHQVQYLSQDMSRASITYSSEINPEGVLWLKTNCRTSDWMNI